MSFDQYSEYFGPGQQSAGLFSFGLKVSTPELFSFAPFLADFNFGIAPTVPNYVASGADTATGYVFTTDAAILFPLTESKEFIVYAGGGPFLAYEYYRVLRSKSIKEYNDFVFGLSALIGVGYRVERILIRLDGKFYAQRTYYPGVTLSIQHEF